MQRVDCPKCSSHHAWYERGETDVTLRCLCGYLKVVSTTLKQMVIEHIDSGADVKAPRKGTKLHRCLVSLCGLEIATTAEVAELMNSGGEEHSLSDVASQLTVLRYKGLVRTMQDRRGIAGGSTWVLTDAAKRIIKGV